MKKLTLNVEELEVNSFATADADEERGTVQAHADVDSSYVCSWIWYCLPRPDDI